MNLNSTPNADRTHIGIFGRRNAGKSSIINAITSQNLAIVSEISGTTTDPVSKAMEILPLGPVLITDTPGFDDVGELGEKRVSKTYEVLRKVDIAILVVSPENEDLDLEIDFIKNLKERSIPYIICINKSDIYNIEETGLIISTFNDDNVLLTSAKTKQNINELKDKIASFRKNSADKKIIADFVSKGDTVVLVIPIDDAAPKGRLILPQQQVIRELLEASVTVVATKETELEVTLSRLVNKPKVVITDSQAFAMVSKIVPEDIYLTSFSILFARYKGDIEWQVEGAKALDNLSDGAKVLISEGCTHHRQCGDIGSVKLPKWIKEYTKKNINFEYSSGLDFPENLSEYDLIIHCGGCMLNEQEMKYRITKAKNANVPITNYGVAISYVNGILKRSLYLLTSCDK